MRTLASLVLGAFLLTSVGSVAFAAPKFKAGAPEKPAVKATDKKPETKKPEKTAKKAPAKKADVKK